MADATNEHLHAIVDMGSNGIRFSISDLAPPTTRIMPTLFQDRAGISLYDSQWSTGSKQPIPDATIADVLTSFRRFARTCREFGVPTANVRVLATEATREALNSQVFRDAIQRAVNWEVTMLPKEDEGRIGAMGVASSFTSLSGLVMDLGGGSTQLTYMQVHDGDIRIGNSISLPLGAAALSRRLDDASSHDDADASIAQLEAELTTTISHTLTQLHTLDDPPIPHQSQISLLLSGGGFRGWGYTLMDLHPLSPYPIPIINGFHVPPTAFTATRSIQQHAASAAIFRISERRASQVPAVALLVRALAAALPSLTLVRFCQGGVREGALFAAMPPAIRAASPISTATLPYAASAAPTLLALLHAAIPASALPPPLRAVLPAFAHALYAHRSLPKEARAAAALRWTTTGALAGTHGLVHEERAALSLALCHRWERAVGRTHQSFFDALEAYAGAEVAWWARYVGAVGALLGNVYPAGVVAEERLRLRCEAAAAGRIKRLGLLVTFRGMDADEEASFQGDVRGIEKVGKKKNWVGGEEGWGIKVEARVGGFEMPTAEA